MAIWLTLGAVITLGACKREPSFDERYSTAQKAIRDKAAELDQDMATRAAEAREAAPESSGTIVETGSGKT